MVIAVSARIFSGELNGYRSFIYELLKKLVIAHPEVEFYFLFDRPFDNHYALSSNVHPLVVSPPIRHPFLWKYWYDLKIPLSLKKVKADVFISPDGICSLATSVRQCLVVPDLGFLSYPETCRKSHTRFRKRNTAKFLNKAKTIISFSQNLKEEIIKHYRVESDKINVVPGGVNEAFKKLSFDEKERAREKYADNKEYFVCPGSFHQQNLINVLKAFSIFKKRLQSSMKLIIEGRLDGKNDNFLQLLKTYKYKSDVVIAGRLPEEEMPLLVGGAYALVCPSLFEGYGPVAEAIKSGVPVLTSEKSMQEIAGEAGLYFNPSEHLDIAEKMMLIYKDENLRNGLIEKGSLVAERFDWQRSVEAFWQSVLRALH